LKNSRITAGKVCLKWKVEKRERGSTSGGMREAGAQSSGEDRAAQRFAYLIS